MTGLNDMSIKAKDIEDTLLQTVYTANGVTYVPHYRNTSVFVGPGYPRHTQTQYSADDLVQGGAQRGMALLWRRSSSGLVNDNHL
jgi:hypothetical protein